MSEKKRFFSGKTLTRILLALLLALLVLQALDIFSTILCIKAYGLSMELNPLVRDIFSKNGVLGMWLFKLFILIIIIPVVCGLYIFKRHPEEKKVYNFLIFLLIILSALDLIYVAVVINNFCNLI